MTPTIDELLDSIENEGENTEEIFTKDARYKEVPYSDALTVVISNKSIGDLSGQISVAGEDNSQYIMFECERYMDGIDLTTKLAQIHYERPDGVSDNSPVANVEYSDLHIRFGWVVPAKAVAVSGRLKIMPFFFGTSPENRTYILKEQYAEYTVHNGLTTDGGIEEPAEESWYQQFLSDILYLRQHTGAAEEAAERAAAAAQAASTDRAEAAELKTRTVEAAEKALQSGRNAKASEEAAQKSATEAGAAKETVLQAREEITADRDQIDLNRRNILKTAIKRTASGRTILIQDSAEMPFAGMRQYGHSRQQTTTGAQLLSPDLFEDRITSGGITFVKQADGGIKLEGTQTGVSTLWYGEYIDILQDGITYFFNPDASGGNFQYTAGGQKQYAKKITVDKSTMTSIMPYSQWESGANAGKVIYPMINAGDTALPWEPYTGVRPSPSPEYPQEIVSTGDDGSIGVDVMGENVLQRVDLQAHSVDYRTLVGNGFYNIDIEKGKTYTVTIELEAGKNTRCYWNGNSRIFTTKPFDVLAGKRVYSYTFESISDLKRGDKSLAILSKSSTSDDVLVTPSNFRLVIGSVDRGSTAKMQSLTISTPNGLPGIPVSSGGNYTDETGQQWIADYRDWERGVDVQRVAEFVVDETTKILSVSKLATGGLDTVYPFRTSGYSGKIVKFSPMYCDKLPNLNAWNARVECCSAVEQSIDFTIAHERLGTNAETNDTEAVEKLKQWLTDNPLTFLCVLATPIETPIPADELAAYRALHTNYPATVITSDDVWTDAEYIADPENHISQNYVTADAYQSLEQRVAALENNAVGNL